MQATKVSLAAAETLACLVFLASCGGGSDEPEPTYTALYPALAAHAAMDEEDFNRYLLTAGRGTDITQESIKSLSVGSSIDSAKSTYNLRPIFNLGRLREDGWLNVDTTGSQERTELRLTSNKTASSASSQQTIDGSASGSFGGFKAAAAYHQANAWQSTNSDGTLSVQMVSANTHNVVSLMSSGFTGSENLTAYLIGTQLGDEQLRGYVATTESTPTGICGGKPYLTSVTVSRYKLADTDPHANVQILTRMENVFADLKAQHERCADVSIQAVLVRQMTELRGKIESAIADFYAVNGDSFVSKTTSMNQAVGKGQLSFSSADGNTEAQYGASLSAEYQALSGGIGATGAFQYYKQNGWVKALQNVQVSAEAKPAGVADTTAWVSSLYTMLKDQSSSVVPPMGSLPKDPGVKLPDPVGPRHSEEEPPDSVFGSYYEWKQYQDDKKNAKDAEELARARDRANSGWLMVNSDEALLQDNHDNAYLQLVAELEDLKERARLLQTPPQASDGNLVRFDKMFVNGFEALPYDGVIPQLRPNLDIPGLDKTIGSFPQLMDIMLAVEKLGKLDSYLRFLANFSVSNVTPEMSARYHQFFQKASSRAYDLVGLALGQGTDMTPAVLAGYKKAMFGTASAKADSELYRSLQDLDYYDYVGTLLDPVKGKAWITAPGGYLPMRSGPDGGAQLVVWTSVAGNRSSEKVELVNFSNPNTDPLALYRGVKAIQTPWYPVYIFNQGSKPTLVFVQNLGAYQAIYGAEWAVRPSSKEEDGSDRNPLPPSLTPKWPNYQVMGNELAPIPPARTNRPMREAVVSSENSFLDHMSWNYSVNFPQSGNDPTRLQKFNLLVLAPQPFHFELSPDLSTLGDVAVRFNAHSAAVRYISDKIAVNFANLPNSAYGAFKPGSNPATQRLVRRMSDGTVVDIAQEIPGGEDYVMLLPLNETTTGESLKQAFNFAPERAPMDIVTSTSLDLVNKLAVLLE